MTEIERDQKAKAIQKAEAAIAARLERIEKEKANLGLEANFITKAVEAGLEWRFIDNMIFYGHTTRFCFGWRKPLEASDVERIKEVLTQTHLLGGHNVDFKTAN